MILLSGFIYFFLVILTTQNIFFTRGRTTPQNLFPPAIFISPAPFLKTNKQTHTHTHTHYTLSSFFSLLYAFNCALNLRNASVFSSSFSSLSSSTAVVLPTTPISSIALAISKPCSEATCSIN